MTTDYPRTIAVWAEGTSPDGQIIMGADTPSGLPWPKDTADLRSFRESTRGHVLIMGSRTYDRLPAGLKLPSSTAERPIIILTSRIGEYIEATHGLGQAIQPFNPTGVNEAGALLHALKHWPEYAGKPVAVIGGPRVIELFEPYYDELIVTSHHHKRYPGTTRAPSEALLDHFRPYQSDLLDSGARVARFERRIPKEN